MIDRDVAHFLSAEDSPQNHQDDQCVKARTDVIGHNAYASPETFKAANWKRFDDVEQPKETESDGDVKSRKPDSAGDKCKRDHLTNNFVNDDSLRIVTVKSFYAPRSPDAGSEEKNYNMRIICAEVQSFDQQIDYNSNRRASRTRRLRHEAGAACRGETNCNPVPECVRLSSLRDFH